MVGRRAESHRLRQRASPGRFAATQLTGADPAAHAGFLSALREMVRLQSWLTLKNGFIHFKARFKDARHKPRK
jgi:hypothetical protein